MRDALQEAVQVVGAAAAIGGSISTLLETNDWFLSWILILVISAAAGVIASTVVKRAVLRK